MKRPGHSDVVEATVSAEDTMAPQHVPVKAYEAPEALVVVAPMPCVQPGDVHIELRGNTLRFWAHLRSAAPREYLIDEWDFGGFEREIEVPDGYGAGIESTLANGQLVIRLLRGAYTGDLKAKPDAV
ncbi:MAG: Hsp20/alpha crystallin family protein [Acidimicrobiales bacterium]|nr:Hsp20/alpha crystallin family protein [Acidimicrobiales bacterium]